MGTVFGLKSLMNTVFRGGRGLWNLGKTQGDEILKGAEKKHFDTLATKWRSDNPGLTLPSDKRAELADLASTLAANSKTGWLKKGFGLLAGGATLAGLGLAGEAAVNRNDSIAAGLLEGGLDIGKKADSITDWDRVFTGFGRFLENLMKFFKNISNILTGKADLKAVFSDQSDGKRPDELTNNNQGGIVPKLDRFARNAEIYIPDVLDGGNKYLAGTEAGILGTALGLWGASKTVQAVKGVMGLAADKSMVTPPARLSLMSAPATFGTVAEGSARIMTSAEISRTAGGLSDDVARVASRGGRAGILAGAAVTGIAGYNWLTGESPLVTEASAASPATMVTSGLAKASFSETMTISGAAFTAAKVAGIRAIPVVGAVATGYETLRGTGSYIWNGEFSKAGVNLVAGAGLTVGAAGGFLTYGLGEVFHAAVRDGSVATFGTSVAIDKAPIRGLFEAVTGYNTDIAEAAPEKTGVDAFKAAVSNSKIVAPEAQEYDAMGAGTGFSPSVPTNSGMSSSFGTAANNKAPAAIAAVGVRPGNRLRPGKQSPALEHNGAFN